jgi:hypothetical protein
MLRYALAQHPALEKVGHPYRLPIAILIRAINDIQSRDTERSLEAFEWVLNGGGLWVEMYLPELDTRELLLRLLMRERS